MVSEGILEYGKTVWNQIGQEFKQVLQGLWIDREDEEDEVLVSFHEGPGLWSSLHQQQELLQRKGKVKLYIPWNLYEGR